jgi:hypothetical protein
MVPGMFSTTGQARAGVIPGEFRQAGATSAVNAMQQSISPITVRLVFRSLLMEHRSEIPVSKFHTFHVSKVTDFISTASQQGKVMILSHLRVIFANNTYSNDLFTAHPERGFPVKPPPVWLTLTIFDARDRVTWHCSIGHGSQLRRLFWMIASLVRTIHSQDAGMRPPMANLYVIHFALQHVPNRMRL